MYSSSLPEVLPAFSVVVRVEVTPSDLFGTEEYMVPGKYEFVTLKTKQFAQYGCLDILTYIEQV